MEKAREAARVKRQEDTLDMMVRHNGAAQLLSPRRSDGQRSANYCNLILIKEEDATRFIPEDLDNGNLAAF